MILNIESKYDKIADELGSYMYCEVSNDFVVIMIRSQ